jgi:Mg-chelatase subunit ChlD
MRTVAAILLLVFSVSAVSSIAAQENLSSNDALSDARSPTTQLSTGERPQAPSDTRAHTSPVAVETISYEVLDTVEYAGTGTFWCQTTGTLLVRKLPLPSGEISYTYCFSADTDIRPGEDGPLARITFPPVSIHRDPASERLVGGDRVLKNLGIVANAGLGQIRVPTKSGEATQIRVFQFKVPSQFPARLSYAVTAQTQKLTAQGDVIAVLAVSEPFGYLAPPDGLPVTGRHRVLCVLDADMDDVLYLCSSFTATADWEGLSGNLRIESLMYQLRGNRPISLEGMEDYFAKYFRRLDLAEGMPTPRSNMALPLWAMHSLAVRDAVDLVAGAAIEGEPNFVIMATIGLVLLVDSGVSAATTLLHEAGVIDWQWDGIPNYIGQGIGLTAAKGYEGLTGTDVDEDMWQDIGGLGGDVASLFIPADTLETGLELTVKGGKHLYVGAQLVKGTGVAGKTLRISRHGMELVRIGKGWQRSEKIGQELLDALDVVEALKTGTDAWQLARKYGGATSTGPSAGSSGDSILFILDTSGSMGEPSATTGNTKLQDAKLALAEAVSILSQTPGNEYALMTYDDTDVRIAVGFTEDHGAIQGEMAGLEAAGSTPLAKSLMESIDYIDAQASRSNAVVVLLSDGKETCGGDPIAAARRFKERQDIQLRVPQTFSLLDLLMTSAEAASPKPVPMISLKVIGLELTEDTGDIAALQAVAAEAGGSFINVTDLSQLAPAITHSVRAASATGGGGGGGGGSTSQPVLALVFVYANLVVLALIAVVVAMRRRAHA